MPSWGSNRFSSLRRGRVARRGRFAVSRGFARKSVPRAWNNKITRSGPRTIHSHKKLFGGSGVNRRQDRAYNTIPYALEERFEVRGVKVFNLQGGVGGVIGTLGKINLNDMTTPYINAATTSRPPYGWPELASRYAKYKVTGCHVKITLVSSNSGSSFLTCAPVSSQDTFTFGGESGEKTMEKPGTDWALGNRTVGGTATANSAPATMDFYMTVQEVEGLTNAQWKADNANYCANVGASPASRPYLAMGVGDTAGVSTPGISFIAECVWYGFMYERLMLGAS